MIVLYIILIILALILCLALFSKLTFIIKLQKPFSGSFNWQLSLFVLGKPVDISSVIKKVKEPGIRKAKKEMQLEETDEKPKKSLREKIHNLIVNIERGRYTYLLSKRYVKKKIKIESLNFDMVFGLEDAAQTGISTGAAWAGLYNVFGFIDRLFAVKSHKFNITPVFDGEKLSVVFESKIRFSVSNIISLAVAVGMNYLKSIRKIK